MKTIYLECRNQFGSYRMACGVWENKAGGVPVVCVHALTTNARSFGPLAEALCKNRRVYCPDIAGRGESEWLKSEWLKKDPALYSLPYYLADMSVLLKHIKAPKVDWVGTSMGGIMGMLLAAREESPIRRLVLNDIGPFISMTSMQPIKDYVGKTPVFPGLDAVELYMRDNYTTAGKISDKEWRFLAGSGTRHLPGKGYVLDYDPAIAEPFIAIDHDFDLWEYYDKIKGPVLVLRGEDSDILSEDIAGEMTQRGPGAKLVTFRNAGHPLTLLKKKQIDDVASFLSNGP